MRTTARSMGAAARAPAGRRSGARSLGSGLRDARRHEPRAARRARLALRCRLLLARHRRVAAAALVGVAVAVGVHTLRPPARPTLEVLVAAHDLPSGHRLVPADLVARPWAVADVPDGLVHRPAGRVLQAPVRRGEAITDARAGSDAAGGSGGSGGSGRPNAPNESVPAGLVTVTVRLTDPAAAVLAVPGAHVDLIAGAAVDPLAGAAAANDAPAGAAAADGAPVGTESAPASRGSPSKAPTGKSGAGVGAGAAVVSRAALVIAAPRVTVRSGAPSSAVTVPRGSGLLSAFGTEASAPATAADDGGAAGASTAGGLPAGVIVVAVTSDDALRLAAVAGLRTLTVARLDRGVSAALG